MYLPVPIEKFDPVFVIKVTKIPEDASGCRWWIKGGLSEPGKNWLTLQVADNEFHGEGDNRLAVATGMMGKHSPCRRSQGLVSLETSNGDVTSRSYSNNGSWNNCGRNKKTVRVFLCVCVCFNLCGHLDDVIFSQRHLERPVVKLWVIRLLTLST